MTKKQQFITMIVSQEELDQIDSEWRPNLEYKSRADYIRAKLNMRRTHSKLED